MRRLPLALVILGAAAIVAAAPVKAAEPPGEGPPGEAGDILVVQVEGMIDPVVADLITGSLERAERTRASVIILQVDSLGALAVEPGPILERVAQSPVPVAVWAGPARAEARGAAAALLEHAGFAAVSPSAWVGPSLPLRLDRTEAGIDEGVLPDDKRQLAERRLRGQAAVDAGVADLVAPTLGDVVVGLHGQEIGTPDGPVRLDTARVVETDDGPRQTASQPVRFVKLSTLAEVQHSLTSPALAYLLLIVGLALLTFEFFTAGVGLATLAGAGSLAGAFFGFSHLPTNWWAVALVFLSAFGFAVDVQAGHFGFWSAVGFAALLAGSLGLFGGSPLLNVPLWLVVVMVVGQTVFMLGVMTIAVRNRFSIPTVGRDSMIGELGEARTDLNPDGVVLVHGAPWRARTRRGRPVNAGGEVRVVAVDQLVLEVEPDQPAGTGSGASRSG